MAPTFRHQAIFDRGVGRRGPGQLGPGRRDRRRLLREVLFPPGNRRGERRAELPASVRGRGRGTRR